MEFSQVILKAMTFNFDINLLIYGSFAMVTIACVSEEPNAVSNSRTVPANTSLSNINSSQAPCKAPIDTSEEPCTANEDDKQPLLLEAKGALKEGVRGHRMKRQHLCSHLTE